MVMEQEDEIEEFEMMNEDWLDVKMLERIEKMSRKCEEDAKLEAGQELDNKTVKEVLGGMEMKDIEDGQEEVIETVSRKEQLESTTTKKNGDMEDAVQSGG